MTGRYRIEIEAAAARQLARLPKVAQARIKAKVAALADDPRPRGATKLVGTADSWRIRVGDYRVVYVIRDDVLVVIVVKIGHRKDVYRE